MISYHVKLADYPTVSVSCTNCLALTIVDPCNPPTSINLNSALTGQTYQLNDPMLVYYPPMFTLDPVWCEIELYSWRSYSPNDISQLVSHNPETDSFEFYEFVTTE